MLARAHVPTRRKENSGPGSPRLGSIVHAEAAGEARVAAVPVTLRLRDLLPPKISPQARVVSDRGAQAGIRILEHGAAPLDILGPLRPSLGIDAFKKLPCSPLHDSILRHAHQHKSIGRRVGSRTIVRVGVDEVVACPLIVLAEVNEADQTELLESPIGESPCASVVGRPGELRRAPFAIGMAEAEVKHPLDRQNAPAFLPVAAFAKLLCSGADIRANKIVRRTRDPNKTTAQLVLDFRVEARAVAPSRVKGIVIGPRQRPVVTILGPANNRLDRRPFETFDDGTLWVRCKGFGVCLSRQPSAAQAIQDEEHRDTTKHDRIVDGLYNQGGTDATYARAHRRFVPGEGHPCEVHDPGAKTPGRSRPVRPGLPHHGGWDSLAVPGRGRSSRATDPAAAPGRRAETRGTFVNSNEAVVAVIDALQASQVPYVLVGSLASNLYGIARSTNDADFVVQLGATPIVEIVRRLGPDFRFDPQMSFEGITATTRYVVEALEIAFKIEFFLLSDDPYDQSRFGRRRRVPMLGREVFVLSVEDVIVTKLALVEGRSTCQGSTRRHRRAFRVYGRDRLELRQPLVSRASYVGAAE